MFIDTLCTINAMWNFAFFVVYEARSAVGATTTLLVDFNLKREAKVSNVWLKKVDKESWKTVGLAKKFSHRLKIIGHISETIPQVQLFTSYIKNYNFF